jgi:hypothetical protein
MALAKLKVAVAADSRRKLAPAGVMLNPHSAPQPELLVVLPPTIDHACREARLERDHSQGAGGGVNDAAAAFELVIIAALLTLLSAPM